MKTYLKYFFTTFIIFGFGALVHAASLLPHTYLTFEEEDTSTSVTVNFMSEGQQSNSFVYYDLESQSGLSQKYTHKVQGRIGSIKSVNRTYHHVKLSGLSPSTTYYFVVGDANIGFSKEYKFRTLPNDSSPIKLVVGGDMGSGAEIAETPKFAVKEEPNVILIGGDIAYANGRTKNLSKWDSWFKYMDQVMISPMGYLIPLIIAIGNHEVTTQIALPWAKAPFYKELFPQAGGRTYFTRKLGSEGVLFVLDTGHYVSHGKQKKFLNQEMPKYQDRPHRLALYHAPLYPSHRSEDDFLSAKGRNNWLRYFDKYNLTAAFEHHDHSFKRSKVLKANAVSSKGTLYVGDGCWGKSEREAYPERWYIEKSAPHTHVWSVLLSPDRLNFMASGKNGEIYDHFNLYNSSSSTTVEEL